ncbi:hypothetical protein KP001_09910 [Geomonas subterranea]|uniref:HNH endonuclease n=1 Tax=Geomonas subterranea TaxID=2847989 RepID=A0ABX8LQD2_9BACT|nr:hypothetical protein [Geomonas subterranea]QXE92804.1 hypothetical protein KP001_09910 [Geomonas subterranea]QXM09093.1 hypothetical protein KP002_19365 [Geomonas subterranea]
MRQLILQPAGSVESRGHYDDTIFHPVALDRISKFVTAAEFDHLKNLYPAGKAHVWGVTSGRNTVKWQKINKNDVAVFAGGMKIFSSGEVKYKVRNKSLALNLWGEDDEGRTWEFIYFLDHIRQRDIPYSALNKHLGYEHNAVIQGFNVIPWEKCTTFLAYLDSGKVATAASSHTLAPTIETSTSAGIPDSPLEDDGECTLQTEVSSEYSGCEDFERLIKDLDPAKPLDATAVVQIRKEQVFLRKFLFGSRGTGICGICGKEFPVDFLVAAHIKRRADCSIEEKLDYKNNVMPICKMGCDDLFEKGYISILNGKIIRCPDKLLTLAMKAYVDILHNGSCLYATPSNKGYFQWHADNRLRR